MPWDQSERERDYKEQKKLGEKAGIKPRTKDTMRQIDSTSQHHTVNENGGKFHLYWWSNISTSMVEILHPQYHGGNIHLQ